MTWKYNDQEIEQNDIYDIVPDNYDINDYEEFINECYATVNICGYEYEQGTLLRKIDPVAFKCAYDDECDYMAREIIHAMDDTDSWGFGIEYIEDDE